MLLITLKNDFHRNDRWQTPTKSWGGYSNHQINFPNNTENEPRLDYRLLCSQLVQHQLLENQCL